MIYPDLANSSYQPTMMSVRPHHDPYRSLPCTPLGMDPRNVAAMDLAPAMNHARMGLEAPDYFSSPRYGGSMRASSPYPHGMDVESGFHIAGAGAGAGTGPYNAESNASHLSGLICRTNLAATLANALISPTSKYGKVFPHMGDDGRYPTDFNTPKTVETMKVLDNSQLDRIMQSYRLPLDLRALPSSSASASGRISPYSGGGIARDPSAPISSSRVRQAKLFALWEFLGCWKLVEHERLRRGGGVMY